MLYNFSYVKNMLTQAEIKFFFDIYMYVSKIKKLAEELCDILEFDRLKFLKFLGEHGKKIELVHIIIYLEITKFGKGRALKKLLLNGTSNVYEIPTDELCIVLSNLFDKFKITELVEIGAGTGLLTARLRKFTRVKIHPTTLDTSILKYCDVENICCTQIDAKNTPVLVSWLHVIYQKKFIEMMLKNKPKYIFLIGESIGGSCYDDTFISTIEKIGYNFTFINAQQISQIDYFVADKIRNKNYTYSRTNITLLSNVLLPSDDDLVNICGAQNLSKFLELTFMYCIQDISV